MRKPRPVIDPKEFRRWLRGQKVAQRVIEQERVRWLQQLTPEESLRIYLEMKTAEPPPDPESLREPSYVLMAMRRLMEKYAREKERTG